MENATISRRYDIKMKNIGYTRIILLEKSIIARCAVESWYKYERLNNTFRRKGTILSGISIRSSRFI